MTDCTVIMLDGEMYCGPMWVWRPKEGWFALVLDPVYYPDAPAQIMLRDVLSAEERGVRTSVSTIEDVDLLARARAEGWDG